MSAEENKEIVRKIFEDGFNNGNYDYLDRVISDKYVNHDLPAPAPGPEGLKQILIMFKAAFPDMKIEIKDLIGEANKVVSRGSWTGTHKGSFMGIPATEKKVEVNFIDMWRLENGMCLENWVRMDIMGLMQQLGVVPSP
jgi:steroid delta-isomerase-like uncharacterized protein